MIQRIQTLYFLIALLLQVYILTGPIVEFTSDSPVNYEMSFKGLEVNGDDGAILTEKTIPLMIIGSIIPLLILPALFLFRKRKIQMRLAIFSILLTIGFMCLSAWYIFYYKEKLSLGLIYSVRTVLPMVSAILLYLGFRGVLKDEVLISSYDRLR